MNITKVRVEEFDTSFEHVRLVNRPVNGTHAEAVIRHMREYVKSNVPARVWTLYTRGILTAGEVLQKLHTAE